MKQHLIESAKWYGFLFVYGSIRRINSRQSESMKEIHNFSSKQNKIFNVLGTNTAKTLFDGSSFPRQYYGLNVYIAL